MTRYLFPAFILLTAALTGCAGFQVSPSAPTARPARFSGAVHGGQQPVAGSTIQLYEVGTAGDGSAATPLLASTVLTDADGNFSLPSSIPCSASTLVYLLATGGEPIPSVPNPNLALMAVIGPCSTITTSTFLSVNELTTVAAVNALFPFMAGATQVGSGASDASALASAFALANEFVSSSTGNSPGPGVPSTMSVPTGQIYALGDIIATCVNSAGGTAANPGTPCGQLFSLTRPPSGVAPADTIQALLDLAMNPTLNTTQLFNIIPASAVFVTSVTTVPPDWRVRLTPAAPSGYVLQVGPSSLTFPATTTAAPTAAQTVIISNSGSSSVTLASIAFTGVDAADFTQSTTCGATLAASTQCQVSVVFTPQATGARTAYLAVSSSSFNSPQYVQLAGTGSMPATDSLPRGIVSLSDGLPSPEVIFQFFPASQDVTLTNAGANTLTISSVTLANNNDSLSTTCGSSLAPGSSCSATINSLVPLPNQLTFATNDPLLAPVAILSVSTPNASPTANLYFSPTLLGSNNSINYTLTNPLFYTLSLSGPNASDFTLSPTCGPGGASGTQCTATVTFTPSAAGLRTAELSIDGEDYIPVTGIGISSSPSSLVTLTPASLTFHDSITPQTLTLSNFGNAAVGIQSVAVQSAPGIDDFSQSSDCGTSLPAQSICTITVGSSRRTMGGSQSLITVSGDFGSLANPIVATADKVYDFGYTLLTSSKTGDTMQAESNNGVQITESVTGTNASDFLAGNCHTSGFEICSASVVFTPSAVGLRTADLTGTSSVNTAPIASYLQGTGVSSPVVSAVLGSTAEEYIPSSSAGSSSFYLINNGTTTLDVAELAIGSPFTLGSYSCGGSAVPPLQSCTVNVTVGGTQWGYVSPNVTVFDSASGQNISLPLYAVVSVGPQVAVSSVSFPNTQINDVSSPVSFTVTPQYGHGVTAYTSAPIQPVKGSCAAGESPCVLSFVFAPTSVGSDSYKIGVEDNFFGGITYVSVTATGTPVVIPGLAGVSPASLSFPTRAVGSTSIPMTVTLSNTGAGSFAITSTGLSGTNASEFSYTSTCGSSVASNGSCTLGVTFAPTSAGSKSASLTIYGDVSAGLPLVIAITGAAQ